MARDRVGSLRREHTSTHQRPLSPHNGEGRAPLAEECNVGHMAARWRIHASHRRSRTYLWS